MHAEAHICVGMCVHVRGLPQVVFSSGTAYLGFGDRRSYWPGSCQVGEGSWNLSPSDCSSCFSSLLLKVIGVCCYIFFFLFFFFNVGSEDLTQVHTLAK